MKRSTQIRRDNKAPGATSWKPGAKGFRCNQTGQFFKRGNEKTREGLAKMRHAMAHPPPEAPRSRQSRPAGGDIRKLQQPPRVDRKRVLRDRDGDVVCPHCSRYNFKVSLGDRDCQHCGKPIEVYEEQKTRKIVFRDDLGYISCPSCYRRMQRASRGNTSCDTCGQPLEIR